MRLKGQISIVRQSGSGEDRSLVAIEVTDGLSGCRLLDVEMNFEDFGKALLGQGFMPCEFDFYEKCPIGKQHQHKQEEVFVPRHDYREREAVSAVAVKPYEVDGWKGRISDCTNHHNRVRINEVGPNGEAGEWQTVTFHRYVEPKVAETIVLKAKAKDKR